MNNEVLNRYGLFQPMSSHVESLGAEKPSVQFLNRMAMIVFCLERIKEIERQIVGQFAQMTVGWKYLGKEVFVSSPLLVEPLVLLPGALTSIVVGQDLIGPILQELGAIKGSVPKSFRKFIASIERHNLDGELAKGMQDYWSTSGSRHRGFRDLDQHHNYVPQYCKLLVESKLLVIPLPDDPEVKKKGDQTFEKGNNAIKVLENSIGQFNGLINLMFPESQFERKPLAVYADAAFARGSDLKGGPKTLGITFLTERGNVAKEVRFVARKSKAKVNFTTVDWSMKI